MDHIVETVIGLGLLGLGCVLVGIVVWVYQRQTTYHERMGWLAKDYPPNQRDILRRAPWDDPPFHERETLPRIKDSRITVPWQGRA